MFTSFMAQYLFSFLNFIVILALLANGIDHWAVIPIGFTGYFASASIVLGVYLCLASLFLLSLEFKALEAFYTLHAEFLRRPLGRGLLYMSLGILTAGSTWYQILSVVLVFGIGIAFLLVHYRAPEFLLVGVIPYPAPSRDTSEVLGNTFDEEQRRRSLPQTPEPDSLTIIGTAPETQPPAIKVSSIQTPVTPST